MRNSVTRLRVAMLLIVTGCSYAFMTPPRSDGGACTTSVVAPVLDLVGAGLSLGAGGLGVFALSVYDGETPPPTWQVAGYFGAVALVSTATIVSAVHGFRAARRCEPERPEMPASCAGPLARWRTACRHGILRRAQAATDDDLLRGRLLDSVSDCDAPPSDRSFRAHVDDVDVPQTLWAEIPEACRTP